MRQRRLKNLDEKIGMLEHRIADRPEEMKGKWSPDGRPVYLEIGCGKGRFITGRAAADPDGYYVGAEGELSVIVRSLEKAEELSLQNVIFVAGYVNNISDFFRPGELSGIYLNFSDPWPKKRHARRRLTHRSFLEGYGEALSPDGFLEFRTDNNALFDFTLEELSAAGMEPAEMTRDLHSSGLLSDDIISEYEEKFVSAGKNINYLRFVK